MAILERFNDIIKANINVLLDKLEDPEKMIDQYLENMMKDLAGPFYWTRWGARASPARAGFRMSRPFRSPLRQFSW